MAFMMIISRFEKSRCLLKSSVSLPWQPNLIKTLLTGAIRKLMIQTREPIPTYTLLNPFSLLWTLWTLWAFQTWCICHKFSISLNNYFVMVFASCGKCLGWNIIQRLSSASSNENFLHIDKIYCCISS